MDTISIVLLVFILIPMLLEGPGVVLVLFEPIRTLLGAIVRKVCKLPGFNYDTGAFGMLGLIASTATSDEVLLAGKKLLLQMQQHRLAYPPSQRACVMYLISQALWIVKIRDPMEQLFQQQQAAKNQHDNQNRQQRTSVSASAWRAILGINPKENDIKVVTKSFRKLAQSAHPDRGGSNERMSQLNWAMGQARQELSID